MADCLALLLTLGRKWCKPKQPSPYCDSEAFMLAELQFVYDIELANIAAMFDAMDISGDGSCDQRCCRGTVMRVRAVKLFGKTASHVMHELDNDTSKTHNSSI